MNLFWLLWLLPFLAIGNGNVYLDVSTLEVPTEHIKNDSRKIYSTDDPFRDVAAEEDDNEKAFLGTVLIRGPPKKCFSLEDIALLRARQGFEWLVPKFYPKYMSNNSIPHLLVRYWNVVNEIVYHMTDQYTERLMEEAFYDTLGAYLRHYLLPVAQVSFYAGRVSLKTVEHLVDIKRECHQVLETNGYGWRMPTHINLTEQMEDRGPHPITREIKQGKEVKEEKEITSEDGSNICDQLDLSQVSDKRQMNMLLPNLEPVDAHGYLTNIYLPFREKRIYSLRASRSAPQLKRFLNTMTACQNYLKVNPKHYHQRLLDWIREFVPKHLVDEQFYPGLGGILKIQESLEKAIEMEDNYKENSEKHGRSISLWKNSEGQDMQISYMDEKLYIIVSIVLAIVFVIVVCCLQCGRLCNEKKKKTKERKPCLHEDIELGEVFTMAKPKRVKREKKLKLDTPRSPLKITSEDRRYYGHHSRSVTSEDNSTSTLGYQLKQKIAPFRFEIPLEKARKTYKYVPLDSESSHHHERKRSSRGK